MGQGQEVRDREQVEAWGGEAAAKVEAAVVKAVEVVLPRVRAVIVSAPTVVQKRPIKLGHPATSNYVPNVGRL